ncbi:IgGFc-binding protein, partial [Calypte anna]
LQTDFGLQVTYDEEGAIMVAVPSSYFGATCGLCGNFNEDPEDEATLPDGTRATGAGDWAESWREPCCQDGGCGKNCPGCTEEEKRLYRREGYCGVIAQPGGPFRHCHLLLDPAPFLEDCAFDTCHYKGHRDTLCKAIAAYVTQCQSHGLAVEPWRTPTFCGPSCPRHSHYELCGTSCPATCRGPLVPGDCSLVPCTEGCFCDQGFLLSGDECVPAGECGCEHRDRYYKKGEVFYASCRERCRCRAPGVLECQEAFCGAHEECRVEDGVLGCYPTGYGRVVVSGDPHYVTFDGRAFDLPGSCSYVLARLCGAGRGLTNFTVLLEQDAGGRGNVALMKKVVVSIHGYTLSVERGRSWEVMVKLEQNKAPQFNLDFFPLFMLDLAKYEQNWQTIHFLFTPSLDLFWFPPSCLLKTEFSQHWLPRRMLQVPMEGFKLHQDVLDREKNTQKVRFLGFFPQELFCSGLFFTWEADTLKGISSFAMAEKTPNPLRGAGSGMSSTFSLVKDDLCNLLGYRIGGKDFFRALMTFLPFFCVSSSPLPPPALSCPPHSHYELCTRTCDFTCASLSVPPPCSWTCFEGCQCDDGFLFDGEACVSLEQCGC